MTDRLWVDGLLYPTVQDTGVDVAAPARINFVNCTVAGDSDVVTVTAASGGGGGAPDVSSATGTLATAHGGTGLTTIGTALQLVRVNSGATGLEYAAAALTLADLFVSPANIGALKGNSPSGNFTVGMRFNFLRPCTWTGVRIGTKYASTKSWKVRAYNYTDSTALANASSGAVTNGVIAVMFSSPVAITNIGKIYICSAYDLSGGVTASETNSGSTSPVLGLAGVLGPNVYMIDNGCFGSGDAEATSNSSSDHMFVEPIFTVP